MLRTQDIFSILGFAFGAVVLMVVVRWRRRGPVKDSLSLAQQEVCEHLRPALELVLAKGCRVTRVGQNHPELPLEIHVQPAFDPKAVYEELKLAEPVFLSERNVLYCKEDWCELHPKR